MAYSAIFARSFSSQDQKKLGCGAFVCCLIIAFTLGTLFRPYLDPLPDLNLQVPLGGHKMLVTEEISKTHQRGIQKTKVNPIRNVSESWSDVYEMTGDIQIHGNSSTVFIASIDGENFPENSSLSIKPYTRKGDIAAMGSVREFTITIGASPTNCTHNHSVPGIVFSTTGFTGNLFHDFTDVLVPLFITSREFNGEVKFVATNKRSWWINKYQEVMKKLSKYEVIDIDREEGVHCFPKMIVGLKRHKEFGIDPLRSPYSMKDFRKFLREVYSLERERAIVLRDDGGERRPRLLIVSRRGSRTFMNEGEIVKMVESLGFEVVVTEADSNIAKFASVVNSCDVMMGVHGAGLTNMVFLPQNALLIQIVPLGGVEWIARTDFGDPAKDMDIRYLEYKIGLEESSLRQQYPPDHQVFRDPFFIHKQGWMAFRKVYLDNQNVTLDVSKFRSTLLQALKLLHYNR